MSNLSKTKDKRKKNKKLRQQKYKLCLIFTDIVRAHIHPEPAMSLSNGLRSHFQVTDKFSASVDADTWCNSTEQNQVADPGFPKRERGGRGRQPPRWGRQPIIWTNFPLNCMKMREIGLRGRASLEPPFGSAN